MEAKILHSAVIDLIHQSLRLLLKTNELTAAAYLFIR